MKRLLVILAVFFFHLPQVRANDGIVDGELTEAISKAENLNLNIYAYTSHWFQVRAIVNFLITTLDKILTNR